MGVFSSEDDTAKAGMSGGGKAPRDDCSNVLAKGRKVAKNTPLTPRTSNKERSVGKALSKLEDWGQTHRRPERRISSGPSPCRSPFPTARRRITSADVFCIRCGIDTPMVLADDSAVLCWGCGATLEEDSAPEPPALLSPRQLPNQSTRKPGLEVERTAAKDIVVKLPMLWGCSTAFIDAVVGAMDFRKFRLGAEVVHRTLLCDSMYVVIRGVVRLFVDDMPVDDIETGQAFGESQLLGLDERSQVSAVVTIAATVCQLHRKDFLILLRDFPLERRRFQFLQTKNNALEYVKAGTIVRPCQFFASVSEKVIRQIDSHLVRRVFFPGEALLEEETKRRDFWILARGTLVIEIAGRRVRMEKWDQDPLPREGLLELAGKPLSAPGKVSEPAGKVQIAGDEETSSIEDRVSATPCVGELGLLGLQEYCAATVRAKTVCHVRCLYRDVFFRALNSNNEAEKIQEIFEFLRNRNAAADQAISAPTLQMLQEVKLFKDAGSSAEFVQFLSSHLEDRMFLAGQAIVTEGTSDDSCMYILTSGKATVRRGQKSIAELAAGAVIGELTVLGLQPVRTATVIATSTCVVQALHRSVLVRGLENFPHERLKFLLTGFKGRDKATYPQLAAVANAPSGGDNQTGQRENVLTLLKGSSPLIGKISQVCPGFVEELKNVSADRIFMPGDHIMEQGQSGDSMFIIISGNASVYVLEPGAMAIDHETEACKEPVQAHRRMTVDDPPQGHRRLSVDDAAKAMRRISCTGAISDQRRSVDEAGTGQRRLSIDEAAKPAHRASCSEGRRMSFAEGKSDQCRVIADDTVHRRRRSSCQRASHSQRRTSMDEAARAQGRKSVDEQSAHLTEDTDAAPHPAVGSRKIRSVSTGSMCGELAMLGVALIRTASVVADTICLVWEVTQEACLSLITTFPEAEQYFAELVTEHLATSSRARAVSIPLFKTFDIKVRVFLAMHCDRQALFPGYVLAQEGEAGTTLFVVDVGLLVLMKTGETIHNMSIGDTYGLTNMLGIHKIYFGTLKVLRTSHVLSIKQECFVHALEKYPSIAAKKFAKAALVAEKKLRDDMQRIAVRKHMWKRYQDGSFAEDAPGSYFASQVIRKIIQQWAKWAQKSKVSAQRRKQRELDLAACEMQIQKWVNGRKQAKAKVKLLRRELYPCEGSETESTSGSENEPSEETAQQRSSLPDLGSTAQRFRSVESGIREWPKPKQSPWYRLKYSHVLKEVVKSSAVATVVLPAIGPKANSGCVAAGVKSTDSDDTSGSLD